MEREATHDVIGKFFEHSLTFILSQRAHIQESAAVTTATSTYHTSEKCKLSYWEQYRDGATGFW
jgi:hypothetical protein